MREKMRSCERKSLARANAEFHSPKVLMVTAYRFFSLIAPVMVVALLFGAAAYAGQQSNFHDHGLTAPVMGTIGVLKSKEMREQRAKLIADTRTAIEVENITPEIRTKVDKMEADILQLEKDIELHERQEARERELATAPGKKPVTGTEPTDAEARKQLVEERAKKYASAFDVYVRHGIEGCSPEQRAALKEGEVGQPEGRAQTITTTGGGYLVPQSFMAELERAQKLYGAVRDLARIIKTDGGNPLPWPTMDDTGNTGEDKAINTAASAQDIVFGQKVLNAYKMDSGLVQIPNELFEDSAIDMNAELGSILGERIARRQNTKYTVGVGTTDFQGVVVGASLGGTFAGVAAITADELYDVQHSVDPAYRKSPKCAWMFNDTTFKLVRKLKDSQNRYLFEPAITAGAPDMLLGKPIAINPDVASPATGLKTVVFGDFSKFIIRDVRNLVIRRLNERYADADQVGFIGWYRGDSLLVSASAVALVYWKQA